jgi:polyhydroxyalkanoate synthesis repressor PhaR
VDQETGVSKKAGAGDQIVIKKYANRRLYDTSTSAYVTLEHLNDLVKKGVDFVVVDAKSGEDLTRAVLGQIIFEQESKGQNMLPVGFLRQLIRIYGDSVQTMLPAYLEMSMSAFTRQQDQWRSAMTKMTPTGQVGMGNLHHSPMAGFGAQVFEEQIKKNMALFEETVRMFSPFSTSGPASSSGSATDPAAAMSEGMQAGAKAAESGAEALLALQKQMLDMQRQIWTLSQSRKPEGGDKT